jgi:hypothetical protein
LYERVTRLSSPGSRNADIAPGHFFADKPTFFARAAFASRYSRVWGTLNANEHRRRHDTDRCYRAGVNS